MFYLHKKGTPSKAAKAEYVTEGFENPGKKHISGEIFILSGFLYEYCCYHHVSWFSVYGSMTIQKPTVKEMTGYPKQIYFYPKPRNLEIIGINKTEYL